MHYRFGDCTLDAQRDELHRGSETMILRQQVVAVLTYLLTQRDRVVSRHELWQQVWGSPQLSTEALDTCLKEVRQAVGDTGRAQRIIRTIRGRGYRFVAPVEVLDTASDEAPLMSSHAPAPVHPPPDPLPLPILPGERKHVTVLAGTVLAAATVAAASDHETLHQLQQQGFAVALEVVQYFGGMMLQPLAGAFLALFGAPVAHEDHAVRAALAALELRLRLSQMSGHGGLPEDPGLAIRLGLHTGPVIVEPLGESGHLNVTPIGDTFQRAEQLQRQAAPGTILASATTVQRMQERVRVRALDYRDAPGSADGPAAFEVLHMVSRPVAPARPRSRFVGRTLEFATLQALWEQTQGGHGHVVHITGELGMGKSRLLEEFRRSLDAAPGQYVMGRCVSYSQTTPYLPLLSVLRGLCGLTESDTPAGITAQVAHCLHRLALPVEQTAPYLLAFLGGQSEATPRTMDSPPAMRTQTFAALLQLCLRSSQQGPLVIEIEDVHWMDATSEAWLLACVPQLVSVPILLLVTFRPGYAPPWMDHTAVTQMALLPLAPEDSHAVLQEALSQTAVADTVLHTLLRKAEGNPFFLEELARTVTEDTGQQPLTLPDTVQAVLAARIDRLPVEAKHLLQVAAVLGKEAPLALFYACTDLPAAAVPHGFAHLQATEFLYETLQGTTPAYTFKHILTQEVAYQSLLQHTRQHYHQRIADMLVAQFPDTVTQQPALVAHHYTAAGGVAAALPYWQQAGQQALARSAHVEAIAHLTQGLALLHTLPESAERDQQEVAYHLALGPALLATKGYSAPEVRQTYERARALCEQLHDMPQLVPTLFGLWMFYCVCAEYQTARTLGEQLLAIAQTSQADEHFLPAHQALGCVYNHLGDPQHAHTHLIQGIRLPPPLSPRAHVLLYSQDLRSACLVYDALPLWALGYPDQALQQCRDALARVQELEHPYSLVFVQSLTAVLYSMRREAPAVQHHVAPVIELATTQEFVYWRAQATMLRGWALVQQGDETGLAHMQQGLSALTATGAQIARPYNLALLAEAYQHVGRIQEGWDALTEAFAVVRHTGERWWDAELFRLKGTFLQQQDAAQWPAAAQCFQQARTIARDQQAKSLELRAAVTLARWWARQGQHTAAHGMLTEIYSWFTEGFDTPDLQEAAALLPALQNARAAGTTHQERMP